MKKRLLSAFLAVMMVLTMAPMAFAAEDAESVDTGSAVSVQPTGVAMIGETSYGTLADAIQAARKNATITLTADTDENVVLGTYNLTLDLNGHTINGKTEPGKPTITVTARTTIKDTSVAQTGTIKREDTAENSGKGSHYVIDIQGNGWLTFESGNVENNSGIVGVTGASLVRVGDDGVNKFPGLNIKGGTFTQDNFIAVKVDRGDLFLNGGTINSANSYAIEDWHRTTINAGTVNGDVAAWTYSGGSNSSVQLKGGIINGNISSVNYGNAEARKATVTITGGTVSGELDTRSYDPQTNELTSITDTSKATIEVTGGTFDKDPTAYVANGIIVRTNGDGKYVADKPYIATVGGTGYYDIESAFKAQTTSGQPIILQCDLTNKDVFNSGSINRTLDLNGHTYTYTGSEEAFDINYSNVTLTVKNGTVVSANRIAAIPSAMNGTITYDNAALVFDGVTMTANGTSGIESNGMNTNDVVTLKNSTLNVPNGFGIYFPSSGTATIEDSTITAKTMGVQVCVGNLNVKNSTITVTGNAVNKTENDGAIEDGAAISVVDRAGYKGLGKVNIESGKFTSIKAYKWDNSTKVETAFDNSKNVVAVSGGVFAQKFDNSYCATGLTVVSNKSAETTTTYPWTVGIIEVKDENEIKTDTQKGDTQATLGDKIAAGDKTAAQAVGTSVTPTTLTDTTPITADDKAQALTELVKNNKVALDSDGTIPDNTTVTVVKKTYLDVTVTAYDATSNTVSMDITPKYNLIAVAKTGTDEKTVTLKSAQDAKVGSTKVKVTLPEAFKGQKVYINHDNKELYVAKAKADGTVEFTTNGFSPFTFALSNPNVVAEVNGNAYKSLKEAIDAAQTGATIVLQKDCTEKVTVAGKSLTINRNGKTFNEANVTVGSNCTKEVKNDTIVVTYTKPSSGGSSSGKTTYKVTTSAVNNGGVNASPSSAEKGATITITLSPDKGYKLDKLTVTDGSGKTVSTVKKSDTVYTFTMPASAVKVGVSYVKATETPSETKFNDVSANDWFASAVDYVTGKGMMNGTADNTFSPKANTTRGMVVTVLYRLENQPSTSAASFADVASGAYYANAVAWANANGIVSGYGSGKFGPNDKVTREQLAAILYRYAQYKKYDVSVGEDTNILSYNDAQSISSYAIPAIQWACGAGVVTGKSGSKLDPKGYATRAEVAAMLMRFCENVK